MGEIEWHDDTLMHHDGDHISTSDSTSCTSDPNLDDGGFLIEGLMEIDELYYDSLKF